MKMVHNHYDQKKEYSEFKPMINSRDLFEHQILI